MVSAWRVEEEEEEEEEGDFAVLEGRTAESVALMSCSEPPGPGKTVARAAFGCGVRMAATRADFYD
jgi:hypothetical protein